jgi:CRISPR-associated protein Cst2
MKNLKTQGFILIDVDVVALNNGGKKDASRDQNKIFTKRISKNGREYTYVSGQAWRYWWRETLKSDFNWYMSPTTKVDSTNQVFTACNPIQYPDDDVFGYMKAATEELKDDEGNVVTDKKGKAKTFDATATRLSPLKNSAIISVTTVRPIDNQSSASRHEGVPVPYTKQEYSAIMKGMFSLDLEQVGTFAAYNRTGFKNLSEKLRKEAVNTKGVTEILDAHLKNAKGEDHKLVRLEKETRSQRITDTLAALKTITGGAMQTNNMGDVTPKFIILATMASGNHPFSHVAVNDNESGQTFILNTEGLKEVIEDYAQQFQDKIFIGVRSGFLSSDDRAKLEAVANQFSSIVELTTVNQAIDKYIEQVKKQLP